MPRIRAATHAGSWYSASAPELEHQIENWLADVPSMPHRSVQAVIAPHAGLRYCGHVMAHAFKPIDPSRVKRIFLLGPSHAFPTTECHLSQQDYYATPLGDIAIDRAVCSELLGTGVFDVMDTVTDNREHSMELLLPFTAYCMRGQSYTLVPIMIGQVNDTRAQEVSAVLAPYMQAEDTLFIISSDFCHWGGRFGYMYYEPAHGSISESITALDRLGMNSIESLDPAKYQAYLQQYGNTICGQYPILILMLVMRAAGLNLELSFKAYDQSSKCKTEADFSVSYASAIVS